MTKSEIIKRLRKVGIIYNETVKLTSGTTASFYCDVKKAYGYPDLLSALADHVGKKLKKKEGCIAATGYGGLPLAAAVAARCGRKLILVRDTPKKHGKGGFIDGYTPTVKDTIVIIDDVLTTGGSIRRVLKTLEKIPAKVSRAIVVVKRGDTLLPIPYDFIFTIGEIKLAR